MNCTRAAAETRRATADACEAQNYKMRDSNRSVVAYVRHQQVPQKFKTPLGRTVEVHISKPCLSRSTWVRIPCSEAAEELRALSAPLCVHLRGALRHEGRTERQMGYKGCIIQGVIVGDWLSPLNLNLCIFMVLITPQLINP